MFVKTFRQIVLLAWLLALLIVASNYYYFNDVSETSDSIRRSTNDYNRFCKMQISSKINNSQSLKLVGLVVVLRNGLRAPLFDFTSFGNMKCNQIISSQLLEDYKSYISVKYLSKSSGGRKFSNDFHDYNILPSMKKCELGQLTDSGLQQILENAFQVADKYSALLKHSDEKYEIKVFSTKSFRTFQSAVAFLYAFLPRSVFEENLFDIQESIGENFCFGFCACRRAYELKNYTKCVKISSLINYVHVKKKFRGDELRDDLRNMLSNGNYMNLETDHNNTKNDHDWSSIHDLFVTLYCHDQNLLTPCWLPNEKCLQVEQVVQVLELVSRRVRADLSRHYCLLRAYGFLRQLSADIVEMIGKRANDSRLKLVLYSGHEESLRCLLLLLANRSDMAVPFASQIVFEILSFETDEQNISTYRFRVLYNGDAVETKICKNRSICEIHEIVRYVHETYFDELNANNYRESCSGSDSGNANKQ